MESIRKKAYEKIKVGEAIAFPERLAEFFEEVDERDSKEIEMMRNSKMDYEE